MEQPPWPIKYPDAKRAVMTTLAVGQGNANLIEAYDSSNNLIYLLLIDCGGAGSKEDFVKDSTKYMMDKMAERKKALTSPPKAVTHYLDAFILSHQDKDHYSILKNILKSQGNYILETKNGKKKSKVSGVKVGTEISAADSIDNCEYFEQINTVLKSYIYESDLTVVFDQGRISFGVGFSKDLISYENQKELNIGNSTEFRISLNSNDENSDTESFTVGNSTEFRISLNSNDENSDTESFTAGSLSVSIRILGEGACEAHPKIDPFQPREGVFPIYAELDSHSHGYDLNIYDLNDQDGYIECIPLNSDKDYDIFLGIMEFYYNQLSSFGPVKDMMSKLGNFMTVNRDKILPNIKNGITVKDIQKELGIEGSLEAGDGNCLIFGSICYGTAPSYSNISMINIIKARAFNDFNPGLVTAKLDCPGNMRVKVLQPFGGHGKPNVSGADTGVTDKNIYSLVTVVDLINSKPASSFRWVFPGDATAQNMFWHLSKSKLTLGAGPQTFMCAPHHGSNLSSKGTYKVKGKDYDVLSEFIKMVYPAKIIISAGISHNHGHPHKSFMDKCFNFLKNEKIADNNKHYIYYNTTDSSKGAVFTVADLYFPIYTCISVDKSKTKNYAYYDYIYNYPYSAGSKEFSANQVYDTNVPVGNISTVSQKNQLHLRRPEPDFVFSFRNVASF